MIFKTFKTLPLATLKCKCNWLICFILSGPLREWQVTDLKRSGDALTLWLQSSLCQRKAPGAFLLPQVEPFIMTCGHRRSWPSCCVPLQKPAAPAPAVARLVILLQVVCLPRPLLAASDITLSWSLFAMAASAFLHLRPLFFICLGKIRTVAFCEEKNHPPCVPISEKPTFFFYRSQVGI